MPRFYLPPEAWGNNELARLPEEEARHASQVLRLRPGEEATVFDGQGSSAPVTIMEASRREVVVKLGARRQTPPLRCRIGLAVAIPKGKTMEAVVQKATELGAAEIFPLVTEHTVARPEPGEEAKKVEKWVRVALESCKQCKTDWLPRIHPPQSWEDLWRGPAGQYDLNVLAALPAEARPQSLREILQMHRGRLQTEIRSLLLCVGPEGDFSAAEYELAHARAAAFMTLGPLTLRVETAAVAALAVASYECAW